MPESDSSDEKTFDDCIQSFILEKEYEKAVEAMVRVYKDRVRRYCLGRLHDSALADDIAQEVFLAAHTALPRFRRECSVRAWLFRIALYQCSKARRDRQRRIYTASDEETIRYGFHEQPTWYKGPGTRASQKALEDQAWACLAQLEKEAREVVLLHCVVGMTWEGVAEILQVSQSTVRRIWRRALQYLKTCLEDYVEE